MYTANPIPTLQGNAANRFEKNALRNDALRGSQDYSKARQALKTILNRSAL